jgi:murein DD-endopeptidase MepM/ murein hydrolase activator NlpD
MIYPFLLYSPAVRHCPIFNDLRGDPYVADLSPASRLLEGREARDQRGLQAALDAKMSRRGHRWGLAPYLERRDTLLADCPQMVAEQRFIHLGLDVIVPLGSMLHAPLAAVVEAAGYEAGEGNYGGYVLLKHAHRRFETFYSFYGHLCRVRLPEVGRPIAAGEAFAAIGDFHENGNWFHHTHLQVITKEGLAAGYMTKGYCAEKDLGRMNALCPSSIPLFKAAVR